MWLKRIMIGLCVAFALAAIGGGVWVWVGFRAAEEGIRAKHEAIRASGAPLTFADAAPPPLPDDENAAVAIEEAFRVFEAADAEERELSGEEEDWSAYPELVFLLADDPWLEDPGIAEAVARWLARREPANAFLQRALSCPECRFADAWAPLLEGLTAMEDEETPASGVTSTSEQAFDSLKALRRGRVWFLGTAALAAREGHAAGAYGAIQDGLRLLQLTSRDDPGWIRVDVRASGQLQLLRLLERIMGNLPMPAGTPARLAALMERLEDRGGLGRAFVNERAQGMDVFRHLSEAVPETDRWMPRFLWSFDEDRYLEFAGRAIALAGRPYAEVRGDWAVFSADLDAVSRYRVFTPILTIVLLRTAESAVGRLAALRLARTVLELETSRGEDGVWPEGACGSVTAIDPWSGRPLLCRPEPDGGVLLYSVGRDGVDDGGQGEPLGWRRGSDLVWRVAGRVSRHP